MRCLNLIRFDLATMLLITAVIAWTLAWMRVLGATGILLAPFALLISVVVYNAAIALVRKYFNAPFRAYFFRKRIIAFAMIPVVYLASTGPAIGACARFYNVDSKNAAVLNTYNFLYEPAATCIVDFPIRAVHDLGISYLRWWMPEGTILRSHGRNYLGLHSTSQVSPNRGLSLRLSCYFRFGG